MWLLPGYPLSSEVLDDYHSLQHMVPLSSFCRISVTTQMILPTRFFFFFEIINLSSNNVVPISATPSEAGHISPISIFSTRFSDGHPLHLLLASSNPQTQAILKLYGCAQTHCFLLLFHCPSFCSCSYFPPSPA